MALKNFDNIFTISELAKNDSEIIENILSGKEFRIERIISTGQISDWFDQADNELVMLLQGSAKIEYETGLVRIVSAGDYFVIKAHEKQKVSYTSENPPCIWLCIFYK